MVRNFFYIQHTLLIDLHFNILQADILYTHMLLAPSMWSQSRLLFSQTLKEHEDLSY